MIEHSIAMVQATLGRSSKSQCIIQANGHWRPRIDAVAQQWLLSHPQLPIQSVSVIVAPLPHQGLGSGTQMACTVAALLTSAERCDEASISFKLDTLSRLSQRGKRSNIGLCGFIEGGFVVDLGVPAPAASGVPASAASGATARTHRIAFPDWPVLIIQDNSAIGDSGQDEAAMFDRCSACANPNREAMVQLVQQEILPAITAKSWQNFDTALGQYGRWAGQIFRPVQGGTYRTPHIAHCVEVANQIGLRGATQSSWGPTVCAIAQDDEHALWCQTQLQAELPHATVSITRATNYPAQVELL